MCAEYLMCKDCGKVIGEKPTGQGRYRTLCDACVITHRRAHAAKYSSSEKGKERLKRYKKQFVCKRCGADFMAQSYRAHCSEKCLAEYEASKIRKATCRKCGIEFRPKNSRYTQYCSRACSFADISAWFRASAAKSDRSKVSFNKCLSCGKTYTKTTKTQRACADCTTLLIGRDVRRMRRANKYHVTRAKRAGVHFEYFDQRVIFERDNWTCRICGVATPIEKRGTYDDDAPELDHIVAISSGGPHTIANSQCACRRCNRHKSNRRI